MLDGTLAENGNAMVIEAWNTILFEKFNRFRELLTSGLRRHGNAALDAADLRPGEVVLDVGCGFGDTTRQIGLAVGPRGRAVGVDCAQSFIHQARLDFGDLPQTRFDVADAQNDVLETGFDVVYSRFGTMFFDSPVAAFRNLHRALRPGGRLAMVVWRARRHSPMLELPVAIVESMVPRPEASSAITCGPGPFALGDPDTTRAILTRAGFTDATLTRHDDVIRVGRDLQEAVDSSLTVGPAGESMRLAGDAAERARPRIEAALREAFAPYVTERGVCMATSAWVVTARKPA
jgi:ubiquinone/menaquinone biosynthesis C-methylase UbiE